LPFFISSCGPAVDDRPSDGVKRTDPPNDETLEDVLAAVIIVARLLMLVVQAEAAMIKFAVTKSLRNIMIICKRISTSSLLSSNASIDVATKEPGSRCKESCLSTTATKKEEDHDDDHVGGE
jgi:hypothetical protein